MGNDFKKINEAIGWEDTQISRLGVNQLAVNGVQIPSMETVRLPYSSKTIVIGDSLDNEASGGWFQRLCITSNQKVTWESNKGVGGNTTTQMLARIQTDVIDYAPDICILGGPTNDHGQGISEETTRANYHAMLTALRAAGIYVVARNCFPCDNAASAPPWNSISARRQVIQRHNLWIHDWGFENGVPILDVYTPTVDETTGGFVSAWAGDGVHPSQAAHQAAVDHIISNGLPQRFRGQVFLPTVDQQDGGLGPNPLFIGDSNADGVADEWAQASIGSKSLIAGTGAVKGNWQQIVRGAAFDGSIYKDIDTEVGETYEVVARVNIPDTTSKMLLRFGFDGHINNGAAITGVMRKTVVADATTERLQFITDDIEGSDVRIAQVFVRKIS